MVFYNRYGQPIPGILEADCFITNKMCAPSRDAYIPPEDCVIQQPRNILNDARKDMELKFNQSLEIQRNIPNPLDLPLFKPLESPTFKPLDLPPFKPLEIKLKREF